MPKMKKSTISIFCITESPEYCLPITQQLLLAYTHIPGGGGTKKSTEFKYLYIQGIGYKNSENKNWLHKRQIGSRVKGTHIILCVPLFLQLCDYRPAIQNLISPTFVRSSKACSLFFISCNTAIPSFTVSSGSRLIFT